MRSFVRFSSLIAILLFGCSSEKSRAPSTGVIDTGTFEPIDVGTHETTPPKDAAPPVRSYTVTKLPAFSVEGDAPNATWLTLEKRLLLVFKNTTVGWIEATSLDGLTFTNLDVESKRLNELLLKIGLSTTDVNVRERTGFGRRYFVIGAKAGDPARTLFRADETETGALTLTDAAIYPGIPADNLVIDAPSFTTTKTLWRLFYFTPAADTKIIKTATTTNEGTSFVYEGLGPFPAGDRDPFVLPLADETYVAATVRSGKTILWNGDGKTFVETGTPISIVAPTLVQLPTGRLLLYGNEGGNIVVHELVRAK